MQTIRSILHLKECQYKQFTGHEPTQGELDRVNCENVGETGHWLCGVCEQHNAPRFMCGCLTIRKQSQAEAGITVSDAHED